MKTNILPLKIPSVLYLNSSIVYSITNQQASQLFDDKAVTFKQITETLSTRISRATEIFDQKVKDKMIDLQRIQNEIKQTHQDIQASVTTNKVNLESFKDSIDTADNVHENLL